MDYSFVNWDDHYNARAYRGKSHVAFHSSPARYKLIGGAMGGSKSVSGCAEIIQLCIDVPGNRCAIIRKNRTVLKRTTMVTFFQICPPEFIAEFNKSELEVTFWNGSKILFIEADESKDPLFQKLKSLELGAYFIDEASEVERAAHQVLGSRLRWPAARGRYFGILGSNPEDCWLKEDFPITSESRAKAHHAYFQFLPKDNPYLPSDYIDFLRSIFDENQQRKYIDGDWTVADDPMQVIPYTALKKKIATPQEIESASDGLLSLGIDVAEYGDDKSVLAFMSGAVVTDVDKYQKKRVDELSSIVQAAITDRSIDAHRIGVDAIGIGAGVWGNVVGAGFRIQRIVAGAKPIEITQGTDQQKKVLNQPFANVKSQMWWKTRMDVMDDDSFFRIPNIPSLIQDLCAPRYRVASEKKITVEEKDQIKKRIGRSPDEGDAVVMANWVREFQMTGSFSVAFEV